MGLMDMFNKVVGAVQNVSNTAQNAKYTYDQAKNTAASLKPKEAEVAQVQEPSVSTDQNTPTQ